MVELSSVRKPTVALARVKEPQCIADFTFDLLKRGGREDPSALRLAIDGSGVVFTVPESESVLIDSPHVAMGFSAAAFIPIMNMGEQYDVIFALDKYIFGSMDASEKPAFVDAMMKSTMAGGLNALAFSTAVWANGRTTITRKVLEFEATLEERYANVGWKIVEHEEEADGANVPLWVVRGNRDNLAMHAYIIAQKPVEVLADARRDQNPEEIS